MRTRLQKVFAIIHELIKSTAIAALTLVLASDVYELGYSAPWQGRPQLNGTETAHKSRLRSATTPIIPLNSIKIFAQSLRLPPICW